MFLSRQQKEILIVSLNPYFLEKEALWYEENFKKISELSQGQVWWRENTLFLEKDQKIKLFELLRRLTELGYERVQTVGGKGEFSQRGGILDIFPVNSLKAFRLEFSGNCLSEIYILEIKKPKEEKDIKKILAGRAPQSLLSTLKPDEYVVHLDHGIGIFQGYAESPDGEIKTQTPTPESPEKFFVIGYAKNDRLYVPLDLEEKLSRYIGFETPIIHRLGGTIWFKTKRKAKESTLALARNLLELYSQRASQRGFRFPADDDFQKEMESSFEYIETEDQLKAINDVKKDMESEKPMDRLICGDVGFGKTEVALRAAFKAAAAGKQVAILTPTTILAHQHFRTFKKRLAKFPLNIALLSRLESKSQQAESLEKLKQGKIDIIIGTHRVIQRDVKFKDLGLAIIDEEQRFGVKQKEKFKEWRKDIDILSLSATPIPRTLNLALSGLRDITLIQTAPPGRLAVKTFIHPFSDKIIKEAIEKELQRNGQIYYLHNRVQTIGLAAQKIENLIPEAKVGIAHGRMTEKQIVGAMDNFETGKINILVATTIIENGLDFPHVNTLIVANAARLGLAQSYQLRGRIGRSNVQANAYFLYNAKKLGEKAQMRLEALKEADRLGAGYQIALRDLEIRGSGNILGREQSGQINAIGLNLYMQMLSEAVEELKT
ncbi:MAG: helicase-related protein [Candidatus Portnoybacteria bacterium]|nr:helicase-related protein [Candidatus Portnoybacteria bacterium]